MYLRVGVTWGWYKVALRGVISEEPPTVETGELKEIETCVDYEPSILTLPAVQTS